MKESTVELRRRVYDLMGGCCMDCEERDYDKLVMDHVYDNGGHLRRTTKRFGATKYRYYLRHGIPRTGPEAIELRCWNCNEVKWLKKAQDTAGQQIVSTTMPVSDDHVQVRLTISKDLDAYLTAHASPTHSKGEVMDDIYKAFCDIALGVSRLEVMVVALSTKPAATEPPVVPVIPYSHRLRDEPPDDEVPPVTEVKRAGWWRR